MRFEFATATRIIFGPGSIREAGPIARAHRGRVLVVTGQDHTRANGLFRILEEHGVEYAIYSASGEPKVRTVVVGVELAHEQNCSQVVSVGGGSVIDAGKAIAAMLTNQGELLDYLEVIGKGKVLQVPSAPFFAIPTTAGTGSEVTRNAVLASPEHKVKVSLRSPLMLPKVAIVDPELTYGLPREITASTGLDALTQLIEPFVSSRANPMIDGLCREGLSLVARSLRQAFEHGEDKAAREDMSAAALFGGVALANAGLGAVHGLAGPIGGMFPAPHGAVCAALLPHVMEVNAAALQQRQPGSPVLQRYAEIARLLTGRPDAKIEDGAAWVRTLVADLQVPGLDAFGIKSEHVDTLVEMAAKASSMKANPIALTTAELAQILEGAGVH